MSSGALRCVSDALYGELIDDAAMFPPRMADLDTALSERLTRRDSPADRFVGSFLVPAGCAAGLLDALGAESPPAPLPVGVIASDDTAATAEAIELLQRSDQVELTLFEMRLDPNAEPERALVEAASGAETSQCATKPRVLCEVPRTWLNDHRMVAAVTAASKAGLSMKLRTGGAAPEAFPTVAVVTRFVAACVEHGVAFKCTAGLHHAVRHHDTASGLTHHGFANVLLATHLALRAAPMDAISEALVERQPACVAARLREIDITEVSSIRRRFLSFGSCDTATPTDDIVNLLMATP